MIVDKFTYLQKGLVSSVEHVDLYEPLQYDTAHAYFTNTLCPQAHFHNDYDRHPYAHDLLKTCS